MAPQIRDSRRRPRHSTGAGFWEWRVKHILAVPEWGKNGGFLYVGSFDTPEAAAAYGERSKYVVWTVEDLQTPEEKQ